MTNETTMQKAERRGNVYVEAVQKDMDWKEYIKQYPVQEGDSVLVHDGRKVYPATVSRIAGNGLRVKLDHNNDILSVDRLVDGVWE